jgi:hypothetical protein
MARVLMDKHQESDMAPKPRRETQDVPDSLPKRDEGTDVMPDKVRGQSIGEHRETSPDAVDPAEAARDHSEHVL